MEDTYPGIMSVIKSAFTQQNLQSETINIIISSLSKNSLKQYNVPLRKWWSFCQSKERDPFLINLPFLLEFMTHEYSNGASYSSLNTCRSALALIYGKKFRKNNTVTRFF